MLQNIGGETSWKEPTVKIKKEIGIHSIKGDHREIGSDGSR
jgi:hypothetical protein